MRRPSSTLQRILGRTAFTLVELLVVIAVIGILASLLLPALTRAKQRADSAACISNLRQVGIALMLYTEDHGAYPTLWATSTEIWLSNWKRALSEYLGTHSVPLSGNESLFEVLNSTRISPVLECPSRTGNRQTVGEMSRTYGYNFWGYNGSPSYPLQRFGRGGDVKDSEVLVPANMLAIGDGFIRAAVRQVIASSELLMRAEQTFVFTTPDELQAMAKTAALRHRGRCNALFCDGHVEQVENKRLFLDDSNDGLRRWNKDNALHR